MSATTDLQVAEQHWYCLECERFWARAQADEDECPVCGDHMYCITARKKMESMFTLAEIAAWGMSASDLTRRAVRGEPIPRDRALATYADPSNWTQVYVMEPTPYCHWAWIGPTRPGYELAQFALKPKPPEEEPAFTLAEIAAWLDSRRMTAGMAKETAITELEADLRDPETGLAAHAKEDE